MEKHSERKLAVENSRKVLGLCTHTRTAKELEQLGRENEFLQIQLVFAKFRIT
jgi:hypothetical protein